MIGGYVVQRLPEAIEVLDMVHLQRVWRSVEPTARVHAGDLVWWQSHTLYTMDVPDGKTYPINNPVNHAGQE